MNIYVHRGMGHYIGSVVVCLAETDEDGARIVREFLDGTGLRDEQLNIKLANNSEPGIIYAQDGDY